MVLIQSLSQNIPIAVLEAVAIMTLVAGIGWILGRRSMNHQIDTIQMEIATKQVELEMCRQGKPKPFRQDKTTKPFMPEPFAVPQPDPVIPSEPEVIKEPTIEIPLDIATFEGIPGLTSAIAAPVILDEPDDLKVIEGIGPKIEQILNVNGIISFKSLASTSVDHIRGLLKAEGPRFENRDPSTWPEQAQLAAEGRWVELKEWQDELSKGQRS
ncbi:hypothetical protein [Siphonobacter sp. SORGH_AS_1065]|uniref:hypothetical protein n=1 Tax=Siphonobacter sp. SORGH_AS_1065 TaxID=3041795 RepID=UPI00277F9004|nr:hypothetical protein [Siphonobacter sp. SORGH_AS_1065]MDQ1089368.1 putative flap endonuclease-1-like 5' DNA nuclease [Siphonobacter sp. SORGH_AS_1065]